MNYLETNTRFNSLSLTDLLRARDQFHVHLMHKPNVVGTAIGRYLIRKTDPLPPAELPKRRKKEPRTLENSEIRDYSWPCVLVFVSEWVDEGNFGKDSELPASGFIPKTIYKAIGGFEYVADFLIGSRDETPLRTAPGDSSTIWTMESEDVIRGLMPIAIQWGGAVFSGESADLPFALATNLSTVCRELDVDLFRSRKLAKFEYWGVLGHYTIGALACAQVADAKLKTLMMANRDRVSFDPDDLDGDIDKVKPPGFVPLADVPDKVWKLFKSATAPYGRRGPENPNHYADIDFSMNGVKSLDAQTPTATALKPDTWINYYRAVGWNQVSERGLLPFRIWQIYKEMVRFATERNVASFVAAAGVLAHYVGDACQPLHGSMYDDGDPFRNPDGTPSPVKLGHGKGFAHGVHSAYEGTMLDENVDTLLSDLPGKLDAQHGMQLVRGGQQAGYAGLRLMRRSQKTIKPIDIVNAYGAIPAQDRSKKGPAILWQKFNKKTLTVLADGCRTLAMLWESAWVEGDGKKIAPSEIKGVSKVKLRKIYEAQDFVPSVALGQIHQYL